jgi:hypothetical protein
VSKSLDSTALLPLVSGYVNVRVDVNNPFTACLIHLLQNDPAVDRWNRMVSEQYQERFKRIIITHFQREDVYKHFRFTSRASWISLTGLVLVPGALLYLSAQQDVRLSITSIT